MTRTRQQAHFKLALEQITELKNRPQTEQQQKINRAYGGLCHKLPFLVRNDGLCQAIAWVEEKSHADPPTPLSRAYLLLRAHMAQVLGVAPAGQDGLLAPVQGADVTVYMRDTREILDAWVYYKRFASSVLNVSPGVDLSDLDAVAAEPVATEAAP